MHERRFNGLTFAADMRSARSGDGTPIEFTRQERAILLALVRRPQRLVPKRELHAVMSSTSAETSERRVDFVVNRLRRKLGDQARAPRFIATQYGEGYAWIAAEEANDVAGCLLVIGPVHRAGEAPDLLETIHRQLGVRVGPRHRLVLRPDLPPGAGREAQFALEVSFYREAQQLRGAFVLRAGESRQVAAAMHTVFTQDPRQPIAGIVRWAADAMWAHLAMPRGGPHAPTDLPASLQLHEAALALSRSAEAWRTSEAQLRLARAERPDDPALAILWALNLHAQLIHWPASEMARSPGGRHSLLEEIEGIVFQNLAAIDGNPMLKLGAAKLLVFVGREHIDLADRLATEAFAQSTAFAAAHATRAELLMYSGRIEEALALYDEAIAMSAYGSEFHIYLLVLKCTALMAMADRQRLAQAAAEMYLAKPETRWLGIFMAAPEADGMPPEIGERLASMRPEEVSAIVGYLYFTKARIFARADHRANVMRGLVWHARQLFGPHVLPPAVAQLFVP